MADSKREDNDLESGDDELEDEESGVPIDSHQVLPAEGQDVEGVWTAGQGVPGAFAGRHHGAYSARNWREGEGGGEIVKHYDLTLGLLSGSFRWLWRRRGVVSLDSLALMLPLIGPWLETYQKEENDLISPLYKQPIERLTNDTHSVTLSFSRSCFRQSCKKTSSSDYGKRKSFSLDS